MANCSSPTAGKDFVSSRSRVRIVELISDGLNEARSFAPLVYFPHGGIISEAVVPAGVKLSRWS